MSETRGSVVVLGASADRNKYGNKAVRAYLRAGWRVYPVNPRGGEIEGLPVARTLAEIPAPVDRISSYLPPTIGITLLAEIAALRPGEFFLNPGAESADLLERARDLGLDPIQACSIIEIGYTPSEFSS